MMKAGLSGLFSAWTAGCIGFLSRQAWLRVYSASVLKLASVTDPAWAERVLLDLPEILLDHAHCEKKAAGAAIKLLFSYPHHRFLVAAEARHHGIYLELASELTNRDTLDARLLELARA